jgi:LacI family transcriptional regulator
MRQLMEKRPRPTAVICGNDVLAIGALVEARSLGHDVPTDVSVSGFDDLEIASLMEPQLTTVQVPSREIGRLTAKWLVDSLAGRAVAQIGELAAELVVRRSTSRPAE